MAYHIRPMFKKIRTIIPETACSTTASVANNTLLASTNTTYSIGQNFIITVQATTGNVWLDPINIATTNSFKLSENIALDLMVTDRLSIISDSTTAKIQALIWE